MYYAPRYPNLLLCSICHAHVMSEYVYLRCSHIVIVMCGRAAVPPHNTQVIFMSPEDHVQEESIVGSEHHKTSRGLMSINTYPWYCVRIIIHIMFCMKFECSLMYDHPSRSIPGSPQATSTLLPRPITECMYARLCLAILETKTLALATERRHVELFITTLNADLFLRARSRRSG